LDVADLSVRSQLLPCSTNTVFISTLLWAPDSRTLLLDRGSTPQLMHLETLDVQALLPLPNYPERYPDLTSGLGWAAPSFP
jgi:hypothetical protein